MACIEKDNCNSIEYNYEISKFKYIISIEKDRYKLNRQIKHSYILAFVSVIYKLYNNVAISNKPPTFRDLNNVVDYRYTKIFL